MSYCLVYNETLALLVLVVSCNAVLQVLLADSSLSMQFLLADSKLLLYALLADPMWLHAFSSNAVASFATLATLHEFLQKNSNCPLVADGFSDASADGVDGCPDGLDGCGDCEAV
jgi:hypothetical protein